MKLTISILCHNEMHATEGCLEHLRRNTPELDQIEFILTDNGSTDNTLPMLGSFNLPNKRIIPQATNIGFPAGHNDAFRMATGEFFLCLNNDMYIKEPAWLEKVLFPLTDPKVGLVGLHNSPRTLRSDGTGFIGNEIDYIEGSFVLGRSADFRKYGLFSPEINMWTFEDSDLSLRFRQMGYGIKLVAINYEHRRSTTLAKINPSVRNHWARHNQKIFLKRWGSYCKTKKFSNKVLFVIPSVGIGDVLRATPLLPAVRRAHPTAEFHVQTMFPDVFLNNPHVTETFPLKTKPPFQYDRIVELSPNYGERKPFHLSCAELAGTTVHSGIPEIYLSDEERKEADDILKILGGKLIFMSLFTSRVSWKGKNGSIELAREIMSGLRSRLNGQPVSFVEVGKGIPITGGSDLCLIDKTNLRMLFALMERASCFIGVDSLPFHIAQAFKTPSVVLFGATDPQYMIVAKEVIPVTSSLHCVGCYQKKQQPGFNRCTRGDEACMKEIDPKKVIQEAMSMLLKGGKNV